MTSNLNPFCCVGSVRVAIGSLTSSSLSVSFSRTLMKTAKYLLQMKRKFVWFEWICNIYYALVKILLFPHFSVLYIAYSLETNKNRIFIKVACIQCVRYLPRPCTAKFNMFIIKTINLKGSFKYIAEQNPYMNVTD
jgi:hypothetical protein